MKAAILVAGCSRRLRPLTDDRPKCLLEVAGRPILRAALDSLLARGIDELTMVTGYLDGVLRDAMRTWYPRLEVQYIHNAEYAETNNAYSLLAARPVVDGQEFFLLDGDIIFDAPILDRLIDRGPDCLALRTEGEIGDEEVKVEIDLAGRLHGRIRSIGKTVPISRAAGESIGIELFSASTSKRLFETLHQRVIVEGRVDEYYEASFQQIYNRGVVMRAVKIEPFQAIEIDTPEDLISANAMLRRRARLRAAAGRAEHDSFTGM